ncbi:MAG TPA: DegT/DnrJ/EryC1/StrS family aminotransferase [Planctomycetaceae bacterium]|jgi:dTDP-4-amino-4,6-dideoxygalactose transaminase|nr:DegT/DnrJ/EryC1/StrS family aminotransferase [Planctomycetaceae bacterium]
MQIPLVDLKAQYASLRDELNAAWQDVLEQTCFILGPPVAAFERDFAAFCGVPHAVGVASGTDALHLIFRALEIGAGDEVIVPAFTFVASALGVSLAGAMPVFVDVRREDGLIDPDRIEEAITERTRAILPVHLYGRCADMDRVNQIARAYRMKIIEDACQAHGATYHGRRAGSLGDAAAFSFYPGKNLGAYGDGGAITTGDSALAERLQLMRNWGSRKKYHHEEIALNSRLDTVQAAILSVKLKHLATWNERRRAHAAHYHGLLAGRHDVTLPAAAERDCDPAYHLYVVRVPDRDERFRYLTQQGVGAGIHYPFPVHRLNAYKHLAPHGRSLCEAESWANECLSLPMYAELTERQIDFVVDHLPRERRSLAA